MSSGGFHRLRDDQEGLVTNDDLNDSDRLSRTTSDVLERSTEQQQANLNRSSADEEGIAAAAVQTHRGRGNDHQGDVGGSGMMSARDRRRFFLRSVFNHLHFDIGIVIFVMLYITFVLLEMIINLDMLTIHHSSPVPHWLHLMSASILMYFVIEVCVRLYAFGFDLFNSKLECFDVVLIWTICLIELICIKREDAFAFTGFFIIFRLWRVANIINGLIRNVYNERSKQVKTLEKEIESHRRINAELKEKNQRLERTGYFYRQKLISNNISIHIEEEGEQGQVERSAAGGGGGDAEDVVSTFVQSQGSRQDRPLQIPVNLFESNAIGNDNAQLTFQA